MKRKKYQILLLALVLAGFITCGWVSAGKGNIKAEAAEADGAEPADTKVKPVEVDYDTLWLKVDANGNTKVYYSDKSKKVWYEAKAAKEEGDSKEYYYIDISWLSSTSSAVINLKGDDDEIVPVTFPARNSKFKAKYDKATGEISFENVPDGIQTFEWRKATSYTWNTASIVNGKSGSDIKETIEKLRISGASIYIRLPQTLGSQQQKTAADGTTTMEFEPGVRQSKEIKINITKLAAAPKVTIDGTKLLLNTKATMEYSLDNGKSWKDAEAKMPIAKITNQVLYTYNANGTVNASQATKAVNVLIRTKKTDKKPASKSLLLTLPAQRMSPTVLHSQASGAANAEVAWSFDESKFYLDFSKASKAEPYEYMVVKQGATPDLTKGWKAVTSAKTISVSSKTAPAGSVIYIRKKTIKASTKTNTEFAIASAYVTIRATYAAAPTSASK